MYSLLFYCTVQYCSVLYCTVLQGCIFLCQIPPPRAKIWPNDMLGEKGGKMHIFPLIGEKYAYFFPNLLLKDLIFLLQGYKRTINYDQRPIFGSDLLKYNIDINMNQEQWGGGDMNLKFNILYIYLYLSRTVILELQRRLRC